MVGHPIQVGILPKHALHHLYERMEQFPVQCGDGNAVEAQCQIVPMLLVKQSVNLVE